MSLFSKKNLDITNKYRLSEKDMIGALEGFPVGVVVRIIDEAILQSKKFKIATLDDIQYNASCAFLWSDTEAGHSFWNEVINFNKFDLFFDKYPEYKQYN